MTCVELRGRASVRSATCHQPLTHLARADRLAGGITELQGRAKAFLYSVVDSPGGVIFLQKTGKGGLHSLAVVGQGNLAIVHLGRSRWVGTLVEDVEDIRREAGGLVGFVDEDYLDFLRRLAGW